MRAVIYARISSDTERQGLGVARQEADCRRHAEQQGWTVTTILTENDRSAYRGKRPEYAKLLAGLRDGQWDVVVCWHPDRLHRSPIELEEFIDVLEESGATVASVMAGYWDLSTASGRLVARQVGAVSRYESEHKSDRQRRKHDELFAAGKPSGGDRCFGYGPDLVTVIPEQAELIRWAAQHILDGGSLRSVCRHWNEAGHLTGQGNEHNPFVVRRLLQSARIAGKRERGEGVLVDAVWEPILPWETVQRLRDVFKDASRRTNRTSGRYLLTGGLARCGRDGCGAKLIARPRADGRRA
ncbi:MAG: recombinase family protein, partial [Chloroflexi bacterium]|nr:recombinase family protein [Chloroflexota bacterium]